MVEFTCQLAGIVVRVQALYPETRVFCREYLTDKSEEDLRVTIQPSDIALEREKSALADQMECHQIQNPSDAYLEILALHRKIAEVMPMHHIILFHGSAVAVDDEAYLFTARSGTGKSTHTGLWRQQFGSHAVMVNDDKPMLEITEQGVWVWGTPWNGKHRLGNNMRVPLKAICILDRDTYNHIEPLEQGRVWRRLLHQTYRPVDPIALVRTMELLDRLQEKVKFYHLGCNMQPEAARIAYEGMKGEFSYEASKRFSHPQIG
jgi:hypothetical protein